MVIILLYFTCLLVNLSLLPPLGVDDLHVKGVAPCASFTDHAVSPHAIWVFLLAWEKRQRCDTVRLWQFWKQIQHWLQTIQTFDSGKKLIKQKKPGWFSKKQETDFPEAFFGGHTGEDDVCLKKKKPSLQLVSATAVVSRRCGTHDAFASIVALACQTSDVGWVFRPGWCKVGPLQNQLEVGFIIPSLYRGGVITNLRETQWFLAIRKGPPPKLLKITIVEVHLVGWDTPYIGSMGLWVYIHLHQTHITRWWIQICFISIPIWGWFPFWIIFFWWVEKPPTNQININHSCR